MAKLRRISETTKHFWSICSFCKRLTHSRLHEQKVYSSAYFTSCKMLMCKAPNIPLRGKKFSPTRERTFPYRGNNYDNRAFLIDIRIVEYTDSEAPMTTLTGDDLSRDILTDTILIGIRQEVDIAFQPSFQSHHL